MDESVEEILSIKSRDIQTALEELRRNEIKVKVGELKSKLPQIGRCTVCTLKIPCKHYSSVSEVPRLHEPDIIPSYTTPGFDVTDYLPKSTTDSYNRGFRMRSKGQYTEYKFDFSQRDTSLPNERRLKQLELIENYREEKLKREIDKIHKLKELEEVKRKQVQYAEDMRKRYLMRQKEKLGEYKEALPYKMEKLKELLAVEKEQKRDIEVKRKRYIEKQKARLQEYHEKKEMLKKISREKVLELQDEIVNRKSIRIKHLI